MTPPPDFLTRIDEYLALAEKATPGPWEIHPKHRQVWSPSTEYFISCDSESGEEDPESEFIAASRTVGPEAAQFAREAVALLSIPATSKCHTGMWPCDCFPCLVRPLFAKYGIEVKE